MAPSNSKTLSTSEDHSIVQFDRCGHIGFRFKNVMLHFRIDDFMAFNSSFQALIFKRRAVKFPDGQLRIVMNTCRREIQLCFDRSEFKTVKNGLKEAALMLEVNQILYPGQ